MATTDMATTDMATTNDSASSDGNTAIGFFSLPRELRDHVYELSLTPTKLLTRSAMTQIYAGPYATIKYSQRGSLLRVCRQVHEEYISCVLKRAKIQIFTNGTWDLAQLPTWLEYGVPIGFLRQIRCWQIKLDRLQWMAILDARSPGTLMFHAPFRWPDLSPTALAETLRAHCKALKSANLLSPGARLNLELHIKVNLFRQHEPWSSDPVLFGYIDPDVAVSLKRLEGPDVVVRHFLHTPEYVQKREWTGRSSVSPFPVSSTSLMWRLKASKEECALYGWMPQLKEVYNGACRDHARWEEQRDGEWAPVAILEELA